MEVQVKLPDKKKENRPILCAQEISLATEIQYSNMKIKREILKYLETNEDKNTTYQSLRDVTKKVLSVYSDKEDLKQDRKSVV